MKRRSALIILACGAAVFLIALYGLFGSASPTLAFAGLCAFVVGLILLIFSQRHVALSRPSIATLILILLGVALHTYEQTQSLASFSVGWLLWALVPYFLCLAASVMRITRTASIAGAAVVLLFDIWVHYEVFGSSTSSTAALALIFAPLWSTLVFAPAAMFITWLVVRCLTSEGSRNTAP